jgi:hypothetical protein
LTRNCAADNGRSITLRAHHNDGGRAATCQMLRRDARRSRHLPDTGTKPRQPEMRRARRYREHAQEAQSVSAR